MDSFRVNVTKILHSWLAWSKDRWRLDLLGGFAEVECHKG
jgi:hypothetical protein